MCMNLHRVGVCKISVKMELNQPKKSKKSKLKFMLRT